MSLFYKVNFLRRHLPIFLKKSGGFLPLTKKVLTIFFHKGYDGLKERALGRAENCDKTEYEKVFNYLKYDHASFFDLEKVKSLIENEKIKVVSFDIFDTLLSRPSVFPTDVLYVLADKVKLEYNIDFISMRLNAESKMGKDNANIFDIYKWISKEYNLSKDICLKLLNEELELEKKLLFRREEIYQLYQHAVKSNKRVIAVSDMYLTEEILKEFLQIKGYKKIDKVYVSNQFNRRKSNGLLFDEVIKRENCAPGNILHIGDNYQSDYVQPLSKGIVGFYYPSVQDEILKKQGFWKKTYERIQYADSAIRLIQGFAWNKFSELLIGEKHAALFTDMYKLGLFGIGPVLLAAMLKTINSDFSRNYEKIFFASRDGYFPVRIYNLLHQYVKNSIKGEYFQSGRILYYTALANDFNSFISPETHGHEISIKSFLKRFIRNEEFKLRIENSLNSCELEILKSDSLNWSKTLEKVKPLIEEYIEYNNTNLYKYYSKIFSSSYKHLVFDCGYSGSISRSLANVLPSHKFDKLYLWETENNKKNDKKFGTTTYSLFGDLDEKKYGGLYLLFEEIFSPVDKRAICVDEKGSPIFIDENYSSEMKQDILDCQRGITDLCIAFCNLFSDYLAYLKPSKLDAILDGINASVNLSPFCEADLFKRVVFPDDSTGEKISLTKKMEKLRCYSSPVVGTGFYNPNNYFKYQDVYPILDSTLTKEKIGVHVHLHDQTLIWELLFYINNLPSQTDVYITTSKSEAINPLERILETSTFFINKPKVILCENRGRDVAPWLINLRQIQLKYDLFAHLHGKRSPQNGDDGEVWRRYLFDNLLSVKALSEIFTIFKKYPDVGCVFPGPYLNVFNQWRYNGIEVIGDNEYLMNKLIARCSSHHFKEITRSDMFFSVGTMFWYRPAALTTLFDANLSIEDFPVEPIGLDGTYAHAVERMLKICCEGKGFRTMAWTSQHLDQTISFMHYN